MCPYTTVSTRTAIWYFPILEIAALGETNVQYQERAAFVSLSTSSGNHDEIASPIFLAFLSLHGQFHSIGV